MTAGHRNTSSKTSPIELSSQSLSLSGDIPVDSLSFSASSSKNTTCDHDVSDERTWANSRGIKFTGNRSGTTATKQKKTVLNDTFTINGKLSTASISGNSNLVKISLFLEKMHNVSLSAL